MIELLRFMLIWELKLQTTFRWPKFLVTLMNSSTLIELSRFLSIREKALSLCSILFISSLYVCPYFHLVEILTVCNFIGINTFAAFSPQHNKGSFDYRRSYNGLFWTNFCRRNLCNDFRLLGCQEKYLLYYSEYVFARNNYYEGVRKSSFIRSA